MDTKITCLGNEGFHISSGGKNVYVDAFCSFKSRWAGLCAPQNEAVLPADIILVTHNHWDHYDRELVVKAARSTGAVVVGPKSVYRDLQKGLPDEQRCLAEPKPQENIFVASLRMDIRGIPVTTMRTPHGQEHNSYRVDLPGFRFFHDGDNEDTRHIDVALLRPLDGLWLCPWQGSGWEMFIEKVRPNQWFIMHLTPEEYDQIDTGEFFKGLCEKVPQPPVVLRPGQTWTKT